MISSNGKLRVALIGAGRMGARTDEKTRAILPASWFPLCHAEAIQSNQDFEFVAICDEQEDLLSWARKHYAVPGGYTDYREMITTERPDVLTVATRTPGRCDIIEFAARNGVRGMHLEKPLGNNVAEVRRAMAVVASQGVKLTYGPRRRYMEIYRKAKRMLLDGVIGTLEEIRINLGRTWLMWSHPHSVDLMQYFSDSGKIGAVQASCLIPRESTQGMTIDDDPVVEWAALSLTKGVTGLISSAPGFTVDLIGGSGILSVVADGAYLESRQMSSTGFLAAPLQEEVSWRLSGTEAAFHELAMAVRGEPAQTPSAGELLEAQLALFSIAHSSLLEGARVDSSMLDDSFTITGRLRDKHA